MAMFSLHVSLAYLPRACRAVLCGFASVLLAWGSKAYAAVPIAGTDARTVPVNVPITINVLRNDYDPDGDVVSVATDLQTQPLFGSATVNPDGGILYTPNTDYVGSDAFEYVVVDANGEQSVGRVEITVSEEILRTIADRNNSRRVATALDDMCNAFNRDGQSAQSDGSRLLEQRCAFLLETEDTDAVLQVLDKIAPEEALALMREGVRSSQVQSRAVAKRLSSLGGSGSNRGLSVNGRSLFMPKGMGAGDELQAPWGVFASIQLETAEKDATDLENGFDSDGNGITVGADYAWKPDLFIGVAAGWMTSDLEYDNDEGSMESSTGSLFTYILWQRETLSVDAQMGWGQSSYDLTRSISYTETNTNTVVDLSTLGKTSGQQLTFSSQVQYHYHRGALSLTPFLKLDYSRHSVDGYSETGSGGFDVTLSRQTSSSLKANWGAQAQYTMTQSWGVLVPTFEIDMSNDLSTRQDDINGQFAFALQGTGGFTLEAEEQDSFFYRVGLGTTFVLPNGLNAFINVQQLLGYDDYSAQQWNAGFRYELK